jgi:hypothetical protein
MRRQVKDWATIGGIILFVVAMVYGIYWFEVNHPCIKYREDTCTDSYCAWSVTNGTGPNAHETCTQWRTRTYPCKTCVERK